MGIKGSIVKTEIMEKIMNLFPENSFSPDGKEIRVDMVENGNPVQIKISLTAVKVVLTNSPEIEVKNEEQFSISESEKAELSETLKEMGVKF